MVLCGEPRGSQLRRRFAADFHKPLRQAASSFDFHPREAFAQGDGHRRSNALAGKCGEFTRKAMSLFALDVHAH